jgi:hypothetical protein
MCKIGKLKCYDLIFRIDGTIKYIPWPGSKIKGSIVSAIKESKYYNKTIEMVFNDKRVLITPNSISENVYTDWCNAMFTNE